jgi:prepilin-type N-terminal cleavage/methylation domain-containing protein
MIRARLIDDRGFTLVELLATMVVGTIVLFGIFGLLDTAVRLQARSVDSVEANGRGRLGIDLISQRLDARICVGDEPSLVAASGTGVEFYASLAPESSAVRLIVQRRRLTITATGVREEIWTSSPPLGPPNLPPASTTTPALASMLVSGVRQVGTTPVFRYYADDPVTQRPTVLLSTPLAAPDLRRAVLIDVSFTVQGKAADVSTEYDNQILTHSSPCV